MKPQEMLLFTEYSRKRVCGSPACSSKSAGGLLIYNQKQHTGSGASTDNLFLVTGKIRIMEIYGAIGAVGNNTTFSGVHLEAFGTGATDMSKNTLDLSEVAAVGQELIKDNNLAAELVLITNDDVNYVESATDKKLFEEGILTALAGTSSYIRLAYTGDADTDVTITWYIRYSPMTDDGLLTAV